MVVLCCNFTNETTVCLFKDMDADPVSYSSFIHCYYLFASFSDEINTSSQYLKSAGISSDWPYGRGCWQSDDKMRIIWFGEEDQLRIMCMKKGSDLLEVFSNLNEMLKTVEGIDDIEFARDENYGFVTSCPSNLGTGMRASGKRHPFTFDFIFQWFLI